MQEKGVLVLFAQTDFLIKVKRLCQLIIPDYFIIQQKQQKNVTIIQCP